MVLLKFRACLADGGGTWDAVLWDEVGIDQLVLCDFQVVPFSSATKVTLREEDCESTNMVLSEGLPVFVKKDKKDGFFATVYHFDEKKNPNVVLVRLPSAEIQCVPLTRVMYSFCAGNEDSTIDQLPYLARDSAWQTVTKADGSQYMARTSFPAETSCKGDDVSKLSSRIGYRRFMVSCTGKFHGGRRGDFQKRVTKEWSLLSAEQRSAWVRGDSRANGPQESIEPPAKKAKPTKDASSMHHDGQAVDALLDLAVIGNDRPLSSDLGKRRMERPAMMAPKHGMTVRAKSLVVGTAKEEADVPASRRTFNKASFHATFLRVVKILARYKESMIFRDDLGLPYNCLDASVAQYRRVVSTPMDLEQVRCKIVNGDYKTNVDALRADLNLIWDNAVHWCQRMEGSVPTKHLRDVLANTSIMRSHATVMINHVLITTVSVPCFQVGSMANEPRCLLQANHPGPCICDVALLPMKRKQWMPKVEV